MRRLVCALQELDEKGVWKSNSRPPYFYLFRRLGFKVRPPYYASPLNILLGMGASMALVWGGFTWAFEWHVASAGSRAEHLFDALRMGIGFGVFMAAVHAWSRRRLKLTPWQALPVDTVSLNAFDIARLVARR